jgi:phage protein D
VQILHNGSPIPGIIATEIVSNNYYLADKFTARFALNADPAFGMEFWGAQNPPLLLDFQLSLDAGSSWTSMVLGQVDHMVIDPVKGLCEVDGRDLTSYFIDTKTQEAFVSKTSSQVVEYFASKHGMTADVTPTNTPVGRYYGAEHERITQNQFSRVTTEWNMMCSLAQHEQFDIWVTGTTVHFHPSTPPDSDPYVIQWVPPQEGSLGAWSNVQDLRMERSMYMAKDIIVAVRSWDSRNGRAVTKFSPTGARSSAVFSGKAQEFAVTVPNLTAAAAQDLANKLREDMTRKERLIHFTVRADLTLNARNMVRVQGTGSSWDQAYYVDSITRHIAQDGGLTMTVSCKNHSPLSEVLSTT